MPPTELNLKQLIEEEIEKLLSEQNPDPSARRSPSVGHGPFVNQWTRKVKDCRRFVRPEHPLWCTDCPEPGDEGYTRPGRSAEREYNFQSRNYTRCMYLKGHYKQEKDEQTLKKWALEEWEYLRDRYWTLTHGSMDISKLFPDILKDVKAGDILWIEKFNQKWAEHQKNLERGAARPKRKRPAYAKRHAEARIKALHDEILKTLPFIDIDDGLDPVAKLYHWFGRGPNVGKSDALSLGTGSPDPFTKAPSKPTLLAAGDWNQNIQLAINRLVDIYPEGVIDLTYTGNVCSPETRTWLKKFKRGCWSYKIKAPSKKVCRHMLFQNLDKILPYLKEMQKNQYHSLGRLNSWSRSAGLHCEKKKGKKKRDCQRWARLNAKTTYKIQFRRSQNNPRYKQALKKMIKTQLAAHERIDRLIKGFEKRQKESEAEWLTGAYYGPGFGEKSDKEQKMALVDYLINAGIKCWPAKDFTITSYNPATIGPGKSYCQPTRLGTVPGAPNIAQAGPHGNWQERSSYRLKDLVRLQSFGHMDRESDFANACSNLGYDDTPKPCKPQLNPDTGDRIIDHTTGLFVDPNCVCVDCGAYLKQQKLAGESSWRDYPFFEPLEFAQYFVPLGLGNKVIRALWAIFIGVQLPGGKRKVPTDDEIEAVIDKVGNHLSEEDRKFAFERALYVRCLDGGGTEKTCGAPYPPQSKKPGRQSR